MGATCSVPTKRILLLGIEKSGKTTLFYYLKSKKFQPVVPTVGYNEEDIQFNKMKMNILDLSEQEYIDQMIEKHNDILCLIDPQGDNDDQQDLINRIKQYKDKNIIYVLTKADEIKAEPEKIIKQYDLQIDQKDLLQISCKTGENIQQVFQKFYTN